MAAQFLANHLDDLTPAMRGELIQLARAMRARYVAGSTGGLCCFGVYAPLQNQPIILAPSYEALSHSM